MELNSKVAYYFNEYEKIKKDKKKQLPGDSYFLQEDEILSLPRNDGDSRYIYGENGFNFWAYTSGYMHCNKGIFSPFIRVSEGMEPRIAFFASIGEEKEETISLLSVPVLDTHDKVERFTVFTKSCVYYMAIYKGIRFALQVFIGKKNEMFFGLEVDNQGIEKKQIQLSTYFNPFLVHGIHESGDNRWFRQSSYMEDNKEDSLGTFLIQANEDLNRTTSISNYGVIKKQVKLGEESQLKNYQATTSRYDYVGGSYGSLHHPLGIKTGRFIKGAHITAFTEVGIAGDLIDLEIAGKSTVLLTTSMEYLEYCIEEKKLQSLLKKEIEEKEIKSSIIAHERMEKEKEDGLKIKFSNSTSEEWKESLWNPFLQHLKKQVEFCSLTTGYVQAYVGSYIGIRDIFQAMEAYLIWRPEEVKEKMIEALNFTGLDGRCPRQYTLPAKEGAVPEMDLRAFIDQGVWVISTIVTYLKYTKDTAFLDIECGYYEIVDEKRNIVRKLEEKDSVLQHLLRIMNFLLSNQDKKTTKCIRVLYGDWNDALDGLGVSRDPNTQYGNGVSVMATLQVYQNLTEMIDLLTRIGKEQYKHFIEEYKVARQEIKEGLNTYAFVTNGDGKRRLVHGWGDEISYYVGSFCDPDGLSRYGLTSNAFWVLAGMYEEDESVKDIILEAFQGLDSTYGMKTFHPHFEPNTKGVGRIPKLPAGTAENGAAYIHATLFGIMALFRMGEGKLAWEQLAKVLPMNKDYVSCSPFVMPNSYCYNEDKNILGYSMADWQTGSSNVLLKVLVKHMIGFHPEYDGLWIQPAKDSPFAQYQFELEHQGCKIHIDYKNKSSKERSFKINGEVREATYDKTMNLYKLWIGNDELMSNYLNIEVVDETGKVNV